MFATTVKFSRNLGPVETLALNIVRRNSRYGIMAATLASRVTPTGKACHGYPVIRSLIRKCRIKPVDCGRGTKLFAV
jgi:hypothetical protein